MARVAFVTGGTRGIGRAISQRLKNDGFLVAAGYSGNEAAAEACASLTANSIYFVYKYNARCIFLCLFKQVSYS